MMKLIPIDPENLNLAWKDVEKYIVSGLHHADGNYDITDVMKMIKDQLLILWVVYNEEKKRPVGCVLTETLDYPKNRVLGIFLISGDDFDEMLTKFDELKEYAKGVGCKKIEFFGRSGWEKRLKDLEFEKLYTVMRVNI